MIAISPNEVWDYQLVADRKEDGGLDPAKTVFKLGSLTPEDDAVIENLTISLMADGERTMNWGSVKLEACRRGLRGCRNLSDASGKPVEFPEPKNGSGKLTVAQLDAFIAYIPTKARAELANAITERNKVTVPEQV